MAPSPTPLSTRRKQALRSRVFWFLAGAGLNYLLITTPFKYLRTHTELPVWGISVCSLAVGATFFFLWNYFINFRTDVRRRDALGRYLAAVLLMLGLSSALLTFFKNHNSHLSFFALDLDVVATQFFLAGLKFFLYHRWVFPVGEEAPAPAAPHKEHPAETLAAEA